MPRGRKDFIQRANEKGGDILPASINGDRILKDLEPETEKQHQQKLDYFVQKERPSAGTLA
ncbi:hypothetical protein GQ44DRAFT_771853 [Phaeosphaeriaceae sp. PMI808]|nr:hypothetical protein GQ44DRAFT_771853 [Phaeosphaeriaceae sp. PMI808]